MKESNLPATGRWRRPSGGGDVLRHVSTYRKYTGRRKFSAGESQFFHAFSEPVNKLAFEGGGFPPTGIVAVGGDVPKHVSSPGGASLPYGCRQIRFFHSFSERVKKSVSMVGATWRAARHRFTVCVRIPLAMPWIFSQLLRTCEKTGFRLLKIFASRYTRGRWRRA